MECKHYENFTFNPDAKHEINHALGIVDINQPIYFIVVTREYNKLNTKLNFGTDWDTLKKILEDICGDIPATTHLTAYNDMKDYVNAHQAVLKESCKIVVFNEHFFHRDSLNEVDYKNFIGDTGGNGFYQLSNSCKKTIFYPNFLRARTYVAGTDDVHKDKYNDTIANMILAEILKNKGIIDNQGAEQLLTNLTKKLLDAAVASHCTQPEIDKLAGDLGTVNLSTLGNRTQLEINNLCDQLQVTRLTVDLATQHAANLAHCLMNSGKGHALTKLTTSPAADLTSALKAGAAKEVEDAIQLAKALSSKITGLGDVSAGFTKSLITFHNYFLGLNGHYGSSRINTTSLMLPITVPTEIISNVTYSIYKGKILTQYEKGAYFKEDDVNIGLTETHDLKTSIYSFGTGSDSAIVGVLTPDHLEVQNALLRNISTEICLDLNSGVRRSNGWSNGNQCQQSKVHILQSNTIDPTGRTYNSSPNVAHLPQSSDKNDICILHADSSVEPPSGSHIFKINSSGAPILHDKEKTPKLAKLEIAGTGIRITVYKLN